VKFPTGGKARELMQLYAVLADSVRFRSRQYSLDERRCILNTTLAFARFFLQIYICLSSPEVILLQGFIFFINQGILK